MRPALEPVVRLALTFGIVWFYVGLTEGVATGLLQAALVVVLAVPTWIAVSRLVFPADGDRSVLPGRRGDR